MDCQVGEFRCIVLRTGGRDGAARPWHASLTAREAEIAQLVAQGQPNKAIAACLRISRYTVDAHMRRIFEKLNVTSRAAMVQRIYDADAAIV
jgi:DNA-binding CsgD family transcriptional regulator